MRVLSITAAAADRISSLSSAMPGKVLRLSVVRSGCSGNRYDLSFAEGPEPLDEKAEDGGATLYVEAKSLLSVLGMTVDWKEDGFRREFTFENPNEAGRCGCGESFHLAAPPAS